MKSSAEPRNLECPWNAPSSHRAAMCGEQSCLGAAAGWEPPAARGSSPSLGGRAHQGPRPGWAVTRRRLGGDRAQHHVLIEINSLTRAGPRREGPSSSFLCHCARHTASHGQVEVASFPATALSRHPCRFGFFTMSDQQLWLNVFIHKHFFLKSQFVP